MRRNHLLGCVGALALVAACGGGGAGTGGGDGAAGAPDDLNGSDQGGQQCREVLATPGKVDTTNLVSADADKPYGRSHLRQDATHIYWEVDGTGSAEIMRVAKNGGQTETVTTVDESEFDFTVDPDGFVYVRTGSGVLRAPVTGGAPKSVLDLSIGTLWDSGVIATDAAHVYVPELSGYCAGPSMPIYKVSKSNGDASPLATIACPREIAIDDGYVYVSADGPGELKVDGAVILGKYPEASLFRIAKGGGSPELLAKVPYGLTSLQVTASYVYGLIEEKDEAAGRTVVRIPVGGGAVERLGDLSCVQAEQLRISTDHTYYASGTLVRTDLDGKHLSTFDVGTGGLVPPELQVDNGIVYQLGDDGLLERHELH